jgi:hypothetical protein
MLTVQSPSGPSTFSTNGIAVIAGTPADGAVFAGLGTSYDITLQNGSNANVMQVPTGTQNAYFLGFLGINNNTPLFPIDMVYASTGANTGINLNVTGTGGGEVDAIVINSDGNSGLRIKNTGGGTNGTFLGNNGGPTADFQIDNFDSGKITLRTASIDALVVDTGAADVTVNVPFVLTSGLSVFSRIINSGANNLTPGDYKALADTTDASASTILLPPGTTGLTFRIAGVKGGVHSYTVTPNGGDVMDASAPTLISAGTVVEYTWLSGTWYAS